MVHNPKLWTLWHYSDFIYRLWWFCLAKVYSRTSLRYARQLWLLSPSRQSFTNVWKACVVPVSPNGIRSHSHNTWYKVIHLSLSSKICPGGMFFTWSIIINDNHLQPPIFTEPNRPIFFPSTYNRAGVWELCIMNKSTMNQVMCVVFHIYIQGVSNQNISLPYWNVIPWFNGHLQFWNNPNVNTILGNTLECSLRNIDVWCFC